MNQLEIKEKIKYMKNVKIISSGSELFNVDNDGDDILIIIVDDNTVTQYEKQILRMMGLRITDDYASIILDSGDVITVDLENGFVTLEEDKTYDSEEEEHLLILSYHDYPEFFKVENLKELEFPIYIPTIESRSINDKSKHGYVSIISAYLNASMLIPAKLHITKSYREVTDCIGKMNSTIIDIKNNPNFTSLGMMDHGLIVTIDNVENIKVTRISGFGEYTLNTLDIDHTLVEYPYSNLCLSDRWNVFPSSYVYIYENQEGEKRIDIDPSIKLEDQDTKNLIDDFFKIIEILPDLGEIRNIIYFFQNINTDNTESLKTCYKYRNIKIESQQLRDRIELGLGIYDNIKSSYVSTKDAILYSDKKNQLYKIDDDMVRLYQGFMETINIYITSGKYNIVDED